MSTNVKVRFDVAETGWGEKLDDNLVRIDNIPLTDALNIGDVVETDPNTVERFLRIVRVVSRKYNRKTAVVVRDEDYEHLFYAWTAVGMKCEHMIVGHVLVAHREDQDPVGMISPDSGLVVTLYRSQPKLKALP